MGLLVEFSKRTWGYYLSLISKRQFKVKLLYFKAGQSCSMQRHTNRKELWCFLTGCGTLFYQNNATKMNQLRAVTGGDVHEVDFLEWHQYGAFKNSLVLEIQTGTCEEGDIERR